MKWSTIVVAFALVACDGGDGGDAVLSTTTTDRLAPSQQTASTIERPDTPSPCDPADLVWWTAQATAAGTTSTAVVRVRNDGDTWCEVDIADSPTLSDEAEPNVWLEPGEWGDVLVGSDADRCSPTVYDAVGIAVGGTSFDVASAGVAACAPSLFAFSVAEPPEAPCADLGVALADDVGGNGVQTVVVRNAGIVSCDLGPVVGSVGRSVVDPLGETPAITALAVGDVVAIDVVPVGGDCASASSTVEFDTAGAVEVPGLDGCAVAGAARPWFGTAPVSDSTAEVLAALDPFG